MKAKTILSIDTSNSSQTKVVLSINGVERRYTEKTDHSKSQNILPLIEKSMIKNNVTLTDIDEIEVCAGPGSFTGLRVGVAVANALGWTQGLKINGKKMAVPKYLASNP